MMTKYRRVMRFLFVLCFVVLSLSVVLPKKQSIVLQPGVSPGVPHQLSGPLDQWSTEQQREIKLKRAV